MVYEVEKQLKEWDGKVPAEQVAPITEQIASLKESIEANDNDAMKTKVEKLEKLFAEAYQAAAAAGAGGPPEGGAAPEGDAPEASGEKAEDDGKVVDADFEVVDKDK